jgi:hypothetical protein
LVLLEKHGEIQDKLEGVAAGYPLTEYHVRQARQAGITPEERVAAIEKAAKEELIANQMCHVAESVTVAEITVHFHPSTTAISSSVSP